MVSKISRPPSDVRWRRDKDEKEGAAAAAAGEDGVALRRSQRCDHRPTFMISDILREREDFAQPTHGEAETAAGFTVEDILRLPQCDAPPPPPPPAGPPETSTPKPPAAVASSDPPPPPPLRVPELPAWIFCTRYSDRPSSGEKRRD